MKQLLRNIKIILILFMILSVGLLAGVVVQQHRSQTTLMAAAGENKQTLRSRYASAGSIVSLDGTVLAQSQGGERVYAQDALLAESLTNLVGDYTHYIQNTIETRYQGNLLGTDRNPFYQLLFDVTGRGLEGDDITLTLDSRLQARAYELLGANNGSVVLLNYQTGDVMAMVSKPSASPAAVIAYQNIPDTALFNRALLGSYYPGSSFKYITAASYMRSAAFDPAHLVICRGTQPLVGQNGVSEKDSAGHGEIDMTRAFEVSCNHYFGDAGILAGSALLEDTAEDFYFNQSISLDRLSVQTSRISIPENDNETLSWVSIGQPVGQSILTATPLHMAMMAGAVGNGGVMMQPHIIDSLTNPLGQRYGRTAEKELGRVLAPEVNTQVEALMLAAVQSGSGNPAQVAGYKIAGKTGTAQVEGQEKYNAVFMGYIDHDSYPYAIAVVTEDSGYGSQISAPTASQLFAFAIELNTP